MEINLPNPIAQTKNLLLKIDEKVTSNEEFADESESDNEDSYYEVDISKVEKKMRWISISTETIYRILMIELKILYFIKWKYKIKLNYKFSIWLM